ncbi:hypothetical protein [Catenulispora subtropica]|uniref:Uncharacterized protein n=1 Tax=Catenulispora subtropica TaxID=450798 RepID=A0ABN2SKS5_9ACTN
MSHAWVQSAEGDLLRADEVRHLSVVEGLQAALVGGDRFLVADIGDRDVCAALARDLAAAMAEAHPSETAVAVGVRESADGWSVVTVPLRVGGPHKR